MPSLFDQLPITMPRFRKRPLLVTMVPRSNTARQRTITGIKIEFLRSVDGIRSQMPLAHQTGAITHRFQRPRQRHRLLWQSTGILRFRHPKTTPETTGQQTGASRRAKGGHIMLSQLNAARRQLIQVRSRYGSAMKLHIRPAQIVRHDKHKIRTLSTQLLRCHAPAHHAD